MNRYRVALLAMLGVIVIAGLTVVAVVERRQQRDAAEKAQRQRADEEQLSRDLDQARINIDAAAQKAVGGLKRGKRKLELEGKMISNPLTPDEAAELRILREDEARRTVDAIGKD